MSIYSSFHIMKKEVIKLKAKRGAAMDKNYKNETSLFPENTPLAMCYVPFQKYDETYPENIALEKGTVFPELYFPFLGDGGDCNDVCR